MTETDDAYGDESREASEGRQVHDPGTAQDIDTSTNASDDTTDVPNLTPDVVPITGNLMPNGLPLLPGVGPELAGPADPVRD